MKFSQKWVQEWLTFETSTNEMAHQLTMAGLEVDEIAPVAGEFNKVFVGEVVECSQHPNADKLSVTKVDIGADETLDIVCGAKNCRKGIKVAVATVGATLPGNFKIKKTKLRGEPSEGMLCAFSELGINNIDSEGIIELPLDAAIGQDYREYLSLDDKTIEVDLTPNRSDCLSIKGIARELSVLNNSNKMKEPAFYSVKDITDETFGVDVLNAKDCPKILTRVVKNVDLSVESPTWLVEKLRRSGIRSIDPIVDITNYVMLLLGQPMHAYDLNKVDDKLIVRKAKNNETLITLDEKELKLKENTLVIADTKKVLGIAGVFGGKDSGVQKETKDILLEVAFFNPDSIKGIARQYNLHTDASHRFERGVDYNLQEKTMEYACSLINEICGGTFGAVNTYKNSDYLPKVGSILVRKEKICKLLGQDFADTFITNTLESLGFKVEYQNNAWLVQVPSWRFDIAIEADLIEEIARIYGYDNLPVSQPNVTMKMKTYRESDVSIDDIKNILVDRGYNEVITYSFVDPKKQELVSDSKDFMLLPNPISVEMSAMRTSLLTGLLNTVSYNHSRQQLRTKFFETGLVYIKDQKAENYVKQNTHIGAVISGNKNIESWDNKPELVDFYDLKGDLESLLNCYIDSNNLNFVPADRDYLHPGQSADIYLNEILIGFIGVIHPKVGKEFDLKSKTIYFELEYEYLKSKPVMQYKAISKFQSNKRDLSIIIPENILANEIISSISTLKISEIQYINIFDVYKGEGIPEGTKSIALNLHIQSMTETLDDTAINHYVDTVLEHLKHNFNAILR